MEGNHVESSYCASGSAPNVSFQDGDGYQYQKKMLPEPPVSDKTSGMDPLRSPQKEASSEEALCKHLHRKSPKLRTPAKTQRLSPFKSTKRPFVSPAKRKESKTCPSKRQKSNEISSEEVGVKRKTSPYDKNKKDQCNLQDENVAKDNDVIIGTMQNNATEGNLPVKNVKPVNQAQLHEQVIEMIKVVLESDPQDAAGQSSTTKIDVAASRFEDLPTMTRARVREFLKKISIPSPIKAATEGPSIMDVEFNEEDDDDEYNPEKDEEFRESDDESITSSKLSEFGSPYRDFASTSFMTPSRDRVVAKSTVSTEVTSDTATEADLPTTSNKSFENVLTIDTEYTGEELDDGIALRTRSKQPLTSTSITEIESAFVAPDITTDMYDNYCDDADYAQFLSTLFKTADDPMTDDDIDANDPEFTYNEAEREQPDKEDFRFDKPTQIPKKELAQLLEELNELYENDVLLHQVVPSASEMTGSWKVQPGDQDMLSSSQDEDTRGSQPVSVKATRVSLPMPTTSSLKNTQVSQPGSSSSSAPFSKFKTPHQPPGPPPPGPSSPPHVVHITSSNSKPSEPEKQSNTFTDSPKNSASSTDTDAVVTLEQRALIADNIRKHIQLLLQSYLLCQDCPSLIQQATESKFMITELDHCRQSSCVSGTSAFSVCNLDPALELLSSSAVAENNDVNHLAEPVWKLSSTNKLKILNSPAFAYPHLLPHLTRPKLNHRKYHKFFHSEDNLIALGLKQFKMCKPDNPIKLIHELLIRGKTFDQIVHRVQYMASIKGGNNPIKVVRKTGELPELFPKTAVDYFYTVAPKDQMSDRLPAWCSTQLIVRKVQPEANTNLSQPSFTDQLSQPSFTGQLSQQKHSGRSAMSTKIAHKKKDRMQQITPSQFQSEFSSSPSKQPVTFHKMPPIQLPTGLLSVGVYFKLSEGACAETGMSAVLEPRPRSTQSHNMQRTKRRITFPNSILKKQRIQASALDVVDVGNRSTETTLQCASPDLLAKTITSSGIQEFLVHPSPESQFQYSHDLDHLGMSFASSTPIAQDKHPSVRNLAWEFDAAHKQPLHSIHVTEAQITEKIYSTQSKSPCIEVSACQTVVSRNETAETPQPTRACLVSLHHNEPGVNGEPKKEKTRISKDSQENCIPFSIAPLVSNHELLCDISKQITASTGNDFAGGTDETSQNRISSNSHPASEMVNMETNKQAPNIVDKNNSKEIEFSIEDQKFSNFSSQNNLMMDITFQSQTENMATVDSGLASDCTNQNDNRTCETVQCDQTAQSVCNILVQNDNGTCETVQCDQTAQSVCNILVQNDNGTCETVQCDQTAQSVCSLSVQNDYGTCETVQGNQTAQTVQGDQTAQSVCNLSVQNDNGTCETVQGDQTVQTVQGDQTAQSVCNISVQNDYGTCETVQGNQTAQTVQGDQTAQSVCNLSVQNDNGTCETVQGDQTVQTVQGDQTAQSVCNISVQNDNGTCETVQCDQTAQSVCNLSVQNDNGTCETVQCDQTAQSVCNLSVQNDNGTCETVQCDQTAQSVCNLSVQNDNGTCETVQCDQTAQSVCNLSVQNDNGTCETVQCDQTAQSVCNLSMQNDNGTCETVQGDQTAQSVCNLSMQNDNGSCETVQSDETAQSTNNLSVQNDNGTCESLQGDQTAQSTINLSVQNDKDCLHNVTQTYEIVQDYRPGKSDINLSVNEDKETLNNLTESNSTLTEDVFLPVLTDESSSSTDKTLTGAPDNISDSINSNESDNGERQAKRKPKTIRQILKAAEKSKTPTTTNTSILTPEGDCVISGVGSPNIDTIIKANETTNMTQLTQGITLTNKNSEVSTVAQQENTSSSSQCFSITTPTLAVALISLQSPVKSSHSNNSSTFPSPFKTPTKLHPLLPKTPSSGSSSSHYVPLPKSSPKRKELNKHVRQILPKSFIFEIKSPSPTKTAAQILKKKATMFCQNRSPVKLLPKQPQTALTGSPRSNPLLGPSRMFTRSQKIKVKSTGKKNCQKTAVPVVKDPPPNKEKVIVETAVMETDEAVLSQEEEEEGFESDDQSQLDDLMAACTTIGYDPKKGITGTDNDNKSKAQKKKDVCLSMLEPDIIDGDAKKDERDTAYAQHYFTHIKQVLGDDAERFKKFLTILHDMNRNHMSPVELYADMATLLSGHQDLVDDFAGFLLSFQAVECNCFVSYMEYQQILTFLRRLEIYCDSSNLTYQRTLKMMSRWLTMLNQEAQADTTPFKEKIAALLRHVPNIMDDLQSYFFGTPLPDSHPDDFEEVDLDEEAMTDVDEFEEITLPEGREDYNTKLCSCQCHQDQQDEKLRRRIKHCYSCSLKIFDGKPVLKTSRNEYRPITVLYPLEEKEKMVKAKKEAAQIALAKARAQRQRKKRKCKKKDVGSLKSKNSKNIPLQKKFKRRKRCKLQSNPADVGNTSTSVSEAESKNSNVQDSVITSTQKQDKSDLKSIYSKPSNHQHKASSGKLTEISTDVSDSASTAKTGTDAENSSAHLTLSTTNDSGGIPTVSHAPEEATVIYVMESKLDRNSSVLNKDDVSRSGVANTEAHFNVEVLSSRFTPTSTPSQKSSTSCSDSNESRSSSVPSVASADILDQGLASSDFQKNKHSVINIQQSQMSMPELNISQTQVVHNFTRSVSGTSSAMIPSQINILNSPKVSFSQVSANRQNVNKVNSPLNKTVVSSQNTTFMSFGLQPRFATSPMLTSLRIPVLVTIAPQQYLPHAESVTGNEMSNLKQTNAQTSNVTTSVLSPHQIRSTKSDTKLENHRRETDPSHNVIYSHPVSTQTLTSSSSLSSSFPTSVVTTDAKIVPQRTGCPASTISDSRIDAISSSNCITSFANLSSSFMNSDNQAASISVSSSEKLAPAVELSDTTSSLLSTPVKNQIPAAVIRAHLDNFSLGAFDNTSISFSQLQQFTQSPSKQFDSVSKFDLLALIESSNLGNKDFNLQSYLASSSSRTQAEPLLTFAGAFEKFSASSDRPELSASDTMQEPPSVSAPINMDDLPAAPGGTRPINDYEMGDDKQAHSIKEPEEDLQNLCPMLNSSQMLLDDESSNAYVLSVWTEEQDRTILNAVIAEGVTQETIKKLHSKIPAKSVEEINSRARLLLQMLEQMGDTESDTDTDTSHVDASENAV